MGVGDWHEFPDGYRFRETLHGPLVIGECVDCGKPIGVVQATGRIGAGGLEEDAGGELSRCVACGRRHHGLP